MPMRFLVTAGSTREKIDRVRDWGNIFTGNTGFEIATALAALGHVDLLTANKNHIAQIESAGTKSTIFPMYFASHAELKTALQGVMQRHQYDAVFMTAAVSDYQPAGAFEVQSRRVIDPVAGTETWIVRNVQHPKVRSNHDAIAFLGQRTEKLVDLFRSDWAYRGVLVKFKLEVGVSDEALIEIGQKSRKASGANYLVANTLDMVAGLRAGAFLLSDMGHEWIPRVQLASRLAALCRDGK